MATQEKPIILSVDDDPQVVRALKTDLRNAYKDTYRIISVDDPHRALEAIEQFRRENRVIALFLSDQRMPKMQGVEFLEKARKIYPKAKRVLLTAYSDTDAAIRAINEVQLDYYLSKPWTPETLTQVLDDLLDEWHSTHRPPFRGIHVLGYQYSPKSHNLKDFLSGNLRPYRWLDVESHSEAGEMMELHGIERKSLPAVIFEDGEVLTDPSVQELARQVGLNPTAKSDLYDVVIVGAGPAGLAAGVYGGSEGLKTLLIEKRAPGGQAGTSSRIENYLGFPKGLSGADLTRRALTQATRFGIEFLSPQEVQKIEFNHPYKTLHLASGETLNAKAVIISTGVDYRKLPAEGTEDFTGAGVYYGAAMTEANACRGQRVYVVGGGNSAGQGAVYLSQYAREVHILVRKPDLSSSMSSYLIDQINGTENIHVHGFREIKKVCGEDHLQKLVIENLEDNSTFEEKADALFIFIGARPYTSWLSESQVLCNGRGFIETGKELFGYDQFRRQWKADREPFLLETSQPGVFAAGDVRAGAMNRVASAVGEGAMAIKFVHEYLSEL